MSSDSKLVITNLFWLSIDKVVRIVVQLVITGKIAIYLASESFGVLNYALAITALFTPIVSLGLESFVVKDLIENDRTTEILSTAFYTKLVIAIVCFIACTLVGFFVYGDTNDVGFKCVFIIATSLLLLPFDVLDMYFQSEVKSRVPALSRLFVFIILNGLRWWNVETKQGITVFAWLIVIEAGLGFFIIFFIFSRKLTTSFLNLYHYSLPIARNMIKQSWPLLLSGLSIAVYMKIDQIMLGLISKKELGYYSAAIKLSEIWNVIPMVLGATLYPILLKSRQIETIEVYSVKMQSVFNLMFILSIMICTLTYFFSPVLITFIFGSDYFKAQSILRLHIWSSVFVFLGVVNNYVLVIEKRTSTVFYTTILGAITNIILNIATLPKFGAMGAAFSTLMSYGVSVLGIGFLFRPNRLYMLGVLNLGNYKQMVTVFVKKSPIL